MFIKYFAFYKRRGNRHLYIRILGIQIYDLVFAVFVFVIQPMSSFFFFKKLDRNRYKADLIIDCGKKVIYCRQGAGRKFIISIQKIQVPSGCKGNSSVSGRGGPSVWLVQYFDIIRV